MRAKILAVALVFLVAFPNALAQSRPADHKIFQAFAGAQVQYLDGGAVEITSDRGPWNYAASLQNLTAGAPSQFVVVIDLEVNQGTVEIGVLTSGSDSKFLVSQIVSPGSRSISLGPVDREKAGTLIVRQAGLPGFVQVTIRSISVEQSARPRAAIAGSTDPSYGQFFENLRNYSSQDVSYISRYQYVWRQLKAYSGEPGVLFQTRDRTVSIYPAHFYYDVATESSNYNLLTNSFRRPELLWTKTIEIEGASINITYFLWPGPLDQYFPALLMVPEGQDQAPVPLVLTPLGCGAGLYTQNELTDVPKRMANLALRGMASFSMVGTCSNPPFSKMDNPGFARQQGALLAFAGAETSTFDLALSTWLQALNYLKTDQRLDGSRIGVVGYSMGAQLSIAIAQAARLQAAAIVATPLPYRLLPEIRWGFVLGREDRLYSIESSQSTIGRLGDVQSGLGIDPPRLWVVPGEHNFDRQRRIITSDWLMETLASQPLVREIKNREIDPPKMDLELPETLSDSLEPQTFRQLFVKIAREERAKSFPVEFDDWPKPDQIAYLKRLLGYQFRNDAPRLPPVLVNLETLKLGEIPIVYRAWVIEYAPGLRTLVTELSPVEGPGEEKNANLFVTTGSFSPDETRLTRLLGSGEIVFTVLLPGYGALSHPQKTVGNFGRQLFNSFTLLGLSVESLNVTGRLIRERYPQLMLNVSSYGVEAGIAALFATALNQNISSLFEYDALLNFDDLLNSPNNPVVPPILFVPGIYSRIDLPNLRRMAAPGSIDVRSQSDLGEYFAVQ